MCLLNVVEFKMIGDSLQNKEKPREGDGGAGDVKRQLCEVRATTKDETFHISSYCVMLL